MLKDKEFRKAMIALEVDSHDPYDPHSNNWIRENKDRFFESTWYILAPPSMDYTWNRTTRLTARLPSIQDEKKTAEALLDEIYHYLENGSASDKYFTRLYKVAGGDPNSNNLNVVKRFFKAHFVLGLFAEGCLVLYQKDKLSEKIKKIDKVHVIKDELIRIIQDDPKLATTDFFVGMSDEFEVLCDKWSIDFHDQPIEVIKQFVAHGWRANTNFWRGIYPSELIDQLRGIGLVLFNLYEEQRHLQNGFFTRKYFHEKIGKYLGDNTKTTKEMADNFLDIFNKTRDIVFKQGSRHEFRINPEGCYIKLLDREIKDLYNEYTVSLTEKRRQQRRKAIDRRKEIEKE